MLQHSSPAGGFMASEDALLADRPAARRLVPRPLLENPALPPAEAPPDPPPLLKPGRVRDPSDTYAMLSSPPLRSPPSALTSTNFCALSDPIPRLSYTASLLKACRSQSGRPNGAVAATDFSWDAQPRSEVPGLRLQSSGPLRECISPHASQRVLITHRRAAAEHQRVVRILLLAAI